LDEVVPAKRMRPKRGRKRLPVRHEGGQDDEHERGEEDDPGRDEQAVIGDGDEEAATSNARRRRPANKGWGLHGGGRHRTAGPCTCTHRRELRTMRAVTAKATTSNSIAIAEA